MCLFNEEALRSFNPDNFTQELLDFLKHDLTSDRHAPLLYSGDYTFPRTEVFLDGLLKKYKSRDDKDESSRRDRTVAKFLSNLDRMAQHEGNLRTVLSECLKLAGDSSLSLADKPLHRALLTARQLVADFFLHNFPDTEALIQGVRSSSGTSIGISYADTSPRAKWTFPITVTKECQPFLDMLLKGDPLFWESLSRMNSSFKGCSPYKVVKGSKHFVVDKDDETDRNCGKEPTGNMSVQQMLMDLLVRGLKQHHLFRLDLSVLPLQHNQWAYEASLDTKSATIDCRNASDSILLLLVEFLCSGNISSRLWFKLFSISRARTITVDGREHHLPIISTMGNAFTFPLETLVFYSLSLAATHTSLTEGRSLLVDPDLVDRVSVFGDDIIVPSVCSEMVIEVLSVCGIEVNPKKTFCDAYPFRESCGTDFFAGHDVRPLNIKAPPQGVNGFVAWLYIISNGLLSRIHSVYGDSYKDIMNYAALRFCYTTLNRLTDGNVFIVPDHFPDSAGLQVLGDLRYCDLANASSSVLLVDVDLHDVASFPYLRGVYSKERRRYDFLSYALSLRKGEPFVLVPDRYKWPEKTVQKAVQKEAVDYAHRGVSAVNPSLTTKVRKAFRWDVSYAVSSGLNLPANPKNARLHISIHELTHVFVTKRKRSRRGKWSTERVVRRGPVVMLD